jgi:hypothetical protein
MLKYESIADVIAMGRNSFRYVKDVNGNVGSFDEYEKMMGDTELKFALRNTPLGAEVRPEDGSGVFHYFVK